MRGCIIAVTWLSLMAGHGFAWQRSADSRPGDYHGVIRGVVRNEQGRTVDGVEVSAELLGVPAGNGRRFVETDAAGTYVLDRLGWGQYAVCARKESDGYADICRPFFRNGHLFITTLSAQSPVAEVAVVIGPRAAILTGSISDANTGEQVSGTLRMQSRDHAAFIAQSVSATFRVLVPPGVDLELEVRAGGYAVWRYSAESEKGTGALNMRAEEVRSLDIYLKRDPPAGER